MRLFHRAITKPATARLPHVPSRRLLVVGLALGLIVASIFALTAPPTKTPLTPQKSPPSKTAQTTKTPVAAAATKPVAYSSKSDGFTITFPQQPKVTQQSSSQNNTAIPRTTYSVESDQDRQVYYVSVTRYPDSVTLPDSKTSLLGGADGMISATPDATAGNITYTTVTGYDALDADYTAPINGTPEQVYARHIMKDRTLYTIFTIGKTQAEFNAFVNSFSFT